MRKLILQMQTSIDGFVAAPDGSLDWMQWSYGQPWNWSEELRRYHRELTASADHILLSDKMAEEGFIDHWASVAAQGRNPQSAFAQNITNAQKIVFTRHNSQLQLPRTEVFNGDLANKVAALKQGPGKNIIAFGGVRFAAALVAADLVDEFHFIVNPTVLGEGLSIFADLPAPLQLQPIDAKHYPDNMVLLRYKR